MKKNAFTTLEVLITLTIIGVISAIIIPVIVKSIPDKNLVKFKKADNQSYNAINNILNSEK